MMKKNSFGISLISLIITIIVIIILAAIVIFTGLRTPDQANFAKFTSEFSDFNLAVDNAYMKEFQDNALEKKQRSKKQVYYKIATGTDVGMNGEVHASGDVVSLGTIYPEGIEGTEYYRITNDTNVLNWKGQKQYFEAAEAHYVTDEGEAFFLPGYLVQEADGSQKWYINESKYYIGEKKSVNGGVVNTPGGEGGSGGSAVLTGPSGEQVKVLADSEITNANYKNNVNISQVLKAEDETIEVPVPTGFTYLEGTGEDGLVVKDASGNEFVWIPVPDASVMYEEATTEADAKTLCGDTGVTTMRWGKGSSITSTPGSTSGYREPDLVTSFDKDSNTEYMTLAGVSNVTALATEMVTEFNNMIDSVIKYKGFYVGRYELGYDGGVVVRKDVPEITASGDNTADASNPYYGGTPMYRWYGLYEACQSFDTSSVKSGMIWGSQWDAMCTFLGTEATSTTGVTADGKHHLTGNYNDEVKNVNDTRGGVLDWVATACNTDGRRADRGGNYYAAFSADSCVTDGNIPRGDHDLWGSRPQLYIK